MHTDAELRAILRVDSVYFCVRVLVLTVGEQADDLTLVIAEHLQTSPGTVSLTV